MQIIFIFVNFFRKSLDHKPTIENKCTKCLIDKGILANLSSISFIRLINKILEIKYPYVIVKIIRIRLYNLHDSVNNPRKS